MKMRDLITLSLLAVDLVKIAAGDSVQSNEEKLAFAEMATSKISVVSRINDMSHGGKQQKSLRGGSESSQSSSEDVDSSSSSDSGDEPSLGGDENIERSGASWLDDAPSLALHPSSSPSSLSNFVEEDEEEMASDIAPESRSDFSCPMAGEEFDLDTYSILARGDAPPPSFTEEVDVDGADPFIVWSHTKRQFYIRPIFYEALPYLDSNKCTRVFAWLSTPMDGDPVPGAVLVHGGGGTALKDWNRQWALHDYASISIAHEGQTDVRPKWGSPESNNKFQFWERHEWAGPYRTGAGYENLPFNEQWMYHAVADTLLANSLLRSLPEVNAGQIGVTGVSWGGVITATAIGFDSRFVFAIPGYGCGSLSDSYSHMALAIQNQNGVKLLYDEVWDPVLRLHKVNMPTLWMSFPEEQHFPLTDQAQSYNTLPESNTVVPVLIPKLGHSHSFIYDRKENYEFAKSIIFDGKSWAVQIKENLFSFSSDEPIDVPPLEDAADSYSETTLPMDGEPMFSTGDPIPLEHHGLRHLEPEAELGEADPVEPAFGGGDPIDNLSLSDDAVRLYHVVIESKSDFEYASLISTTGSLTISASRRKWVENKNVVNMNKVKCDTTVTPERCTWSATAKLPPGTTSWYVNLCTTTEKDVCISSKYRELES